MVDKGKLSVRLSHSAAATSVSWTSSEAAWLDAQIAPGNLSISLTHSGVPGELALASDSHLLCVCVSVDVREEEENSGNLMMQNRPERRAERQVT